MSLSPDATARGFLTADAHFATATITIFDGKFRRISIGTGVITRQALEPGLYLVRYEASGLMTDRYVTVTQGHEVIAPGPDWPAAQPIIPGAAPSIETAITEQCNGALIEKGTGSELFLFFFDSSSRSGGLNSGISLHDANGNLLFDLDREGARGADWLAGRIELAATSHFIRMNAGQEFSIEQTVHQCKDWQTRVILRAREYGRADRVRGADVSAADVSMGPRGSSIANASRDLAWLRTARQSLSTKQAAAPKERLREAANLRREIAASVQDDQLRGDMLRNKLSNPMLGIVGAHLLLLDAEPDTELLIEVIGVLRKLIGEHPDVTALDLWLDASSDPQAVYATPPMLWSSWRIILNRSIERPDLVPSGSYSSRMAGQTWGSGTWLAWQGLDQPSLATPAGAIAAQDVPRKLEALIAALNSVPDFPTRISAGDVTSGEQILLNYLSGLNTMSRLSDVVIENLHRSGILGSLWNWWQVINPRTAIPKKEDMIASMESNLAKNLSEPNLVQSLGLPPAVLQEVVGSLVRKIESLQHDRPLV